MIDPALGAAANDRLKKRSTDVLAASLIAAVGVHFLVPSLWPPITVEDWARLAEQPSEILQFDEIVLPIPPEAIPRPAMPVVGVEAPDEATIVPFTMDEARELPPPPPPPTEIGGAGDRFVIVYEVAPRLTNADAFQRALARAYPAALRDAGVGGVVVLQAYISEAGRVLEATVTGSSGYARLDDTALGLVDVMRFSPALNRDREVAVWVELPIEFRVRDQG
jgi:protein TonB